MRTLLRVVVACALALCWGLNASAGDPKSSELKWAMPKRTYALFAARVENLKPPEPGKAQDQSGDMQMTPSAKPVHFYGYEISETGEFPMKTWGYMSMEEMIFQCAVHVPGKKVALGEKWARTWTPTGITGFGTGSTPIKSEYTLTSLVEENDEVIATITASHKCDAAKPDKSQSYSTFLEFRFDSVTRFNATKQQALSVEMELHAIRHDNYPTSSPPTNRRYFYDWKLNFAPKRIYDSTEDTVLRRDVITAINRGCEFLRKGQKDGLWTSYSTHKRGASALCLLALLMCGEPVTSEYVTKAFAAIAPLEFDDTYSVALSLMAYEARYITDEERRAFLEGKKLDDLKRDISAEDRKEMQRLLNWLAENQNKKNAFWWYSRKMMEQPPYDGKTEFYDFSNTQYALLGLGSAIRCGLKIPNGIIRRFGEEMLKAQEQSGPDIKRVVGGTPPKPRDDKGKTGTKEEREPRLTRATKTVKARGWAYSATAGVVPGRTTTSYGSMTCSGIACMLLAADIVNQMKPAQLREEFPNTQVQDFINKCAASAECGLAWLEVYFSVTHNPFSQGGWYYYYLYAVERAGVLGNSRYLGEHDWYNEGAAALVSLQDDSGKWETETDTAFALLFLKKGTVPMRKPVITGSDK